MTIPLSPLSPLTTVITAAPAEAASATLVSDLKVKPLFKGSTWHFNYQAEMSFTVYAGSYKAGDVMTFKLSPGYQPGWNGDVPIKHTDGQTIMGYASRVDGDNFKITFAAGVDAFKDSTISVVLPIKYEYKEDLADGLKGDGSNELNLTVNGVLQKTGSSFYFQKSRLFSDSSLLYATYQPSDGNIKMGAVVQFNSSAVAGVITATIKSDGNWAPDCAAPIDRIWSDTDITDGSWDGPDLSKQATIVSCTATQLVVRVANVPAGYGVSVRTNGWATKTVDTYRHYGTVLAADGRTSTHTSTAKPGVPLGTGTGSSDVTTGTVYWDANQNGWRDPGEDITIPGATIAFSGIRIPNVSYQTGDPEQKSGFITTDANGNFASNYSYSDLGYYIYLEDFGPNSHPNWRVTTGKKLQRSGTQGSDVNTRVDFGVYAPPVVTVEKNANSAEFGGQTTSGTNVTWTYTVTNAGYVNLKDLKVTDDQGVVVTCPVTVLAVGASTTCTGTGTVTPNTDAMPIREDKSYQGGDAELVAPDPVSAYAVVDPIKTKYDSLGGTQWALAAADMVTGGPLGSTSQDFIVPDNSGDTYTIIHTSATGAHVVDRTSELGKHYFASGAVASNGAPVMDETVAGTDPIDQWGSNTDVDRNWYHQDFANGPNITTFVANNTGLRGYIKQWGGIGKAWLANGKFEGPWGYPTSDGSATVTGGWSQDFKNKSGKTMTISYSNTYGAHPIYIGLGTMDAAERIGRK